MRFTAQDKLDLVARLVRQRGMDKKDREIMKAIVKDYENDVDMAKRQMRLL